MPYNQEQQRSLFSQEDPFETTEQAMRKLYRPEESYTVPITDRLSITPELSYEMIKESQGLTDIDINSRRFGAGVNTPWGTFRGGKNLVNVDVESPERQEEFKGKGYSVGYSKFDKKSGYGGLVQVGIQPGQEGQRTSWNIHATAVWDSGQLFGTIIKAFKELAD